MRREAEHTRRSISPATALAALGVLVLALTPLVAGGNDLFRINLVILYACAALGMYIALQVSGEFMIGHVAIAGVAAYASAYFNIERGWNSVLTVIPAVVLGAIGAVVLGSPGLRLSTYYLGVMAFFAVLILPDLSLVFDSVTGGEAGTPGLDKLGLGDAFSAKVVFEVAVLVLVLSAMFTRNIVRTMWGTRLYALRDAPQALQMAGVDTRSTKVLAYLASSLPASLAGWLLAYVNGIVIAGFFGIALTLVLLAATIAGGRRTVVGTIIATFIFAGYSQMVGQFSKYNELGLGFILLGVILIAPAGIDTLRLRPRRTFEQATHEVTSDEVAHDDVEVDLHALRATAPPTEQLASLEVASVSKSFGGNHALRDVSFRLPAGRVVGLVGANGSGKTTLVNVITGFVQPDHGVVRVRGQEVTGKRPSQIARAGVSRTFQVPQLIADLSVRRNIEVGLLHRTPDPASAMVTGRRLGSRAARQRAEVVDEVVTLLRLDAALLDVRADALSLGMKRVIEIGRAIASGADVVCLDEPAAGLNEDEIERLGLTIGDISASGRSVLLVEHHMRFVLEVCDDLLVLESGQVASWIPDARHAEHTDALRRHMGATA